MFFSGNEQVDQVVWAAMDAAMRNDEKAVLAALPRLRMALADVPMDAVKKAEAIAAYDDLVMQFTKAAVS